MKSMILVALALVAVAAADPAEEPVQIISSNYEQQPNGEYVFSYEGADGNKREEVANLKQGVDEENKPVNFLEVRGSYSYVDVNGQPQVVSYVADQDGYKAEGAIIPKVE